MIVCKSQYGKKPLRISFDAVNACIEKRGRDQYLSLSNPNSSHIYYHNYIKIWISSDDNLSLKKSLKI